MASFGRKNEKVGSHWKINLFAKGTRKKLAMKREKRIRKALVVHDRKYHLFLAPSAGRGKVGGERKDVQPVTKKDGRNFFFGTRHFGALENFCQALSGG